MIIMAFMPDRNTKEILGLPGDAKIRTPDVKGMRSGKASRWTRI